MRLLSALLIAATVGTSGVTADPGPKDAPKPDPKLIGRWLLVRSFAWDREATEDPPRTEYEFTADGKWTMRRDGKEDPAGPGSFTTDPAAKPAQIDLTVRDHHDPKHLTVVRGIYKIEGDTLTFRNSTNSDERLRSFDDPNKGFHAVFKRVTKEQPVPKATAKIDPRLVGRWALEQSFKGNEETTGTFPPFESEFTADATRTDWREGKELSRPAVFTTDASAKPARIDIIPCPGHPLYHGLIQGIYKVERDTLTLATPKWGEPAPTSFDDIGKDGERFVFKRAKVVAPPAPKVVPKPDPKLIGRWTVVRSFNGETETTKRDDVEEYEFTADNKWVFRRDGVDSLAGPGTFITDSTAKPAQIDLVTEVKDLKIRMEVKGVYRIEGDTLTIRTGEPGADRPAAFGAKGKGYLVEFKRAKKKD